MGQLTTFRTAGAIITKLATTSDWENDIQDASTGNYVYSLNPTGTGTTTSGAGMSAAYTSGRGGATVGSIARTFYQFTVPSEAVGLITGITLRILPYQYSLGDVVVAKSTAVTFNNTYDVGHFGSFQGTAYSSVINPSGGSSPTWPTTNGSTDTFDITLNSNAISDANANSGLVNIVLMNYTYDFEISAPSLGTSVYNGIRMVHGTDDTYGSRERLIVDYGYGNIVAGVAGTNIAKIIDVDTADIDKVTGVSYT
jgi:hypothetical protein